MCDIPTLVATIVTVSTSVALSVEQAKTQATQANRQQNAITAAELVQQKQLQERAGQEGEAADERVSQINLETERAASLANTMQLEAGVKGNSARAQLRAIRSQGLRGVTAVERNESWASRQLGYERQAVRARSSRQGLALNYGAGIGAAASQGTLSGISSGLSLGSAYNEIKG
jgi:hypothetical protein